MIELVDHCLNMFKVNVVELTFLWKVLTDQAIGVFVGAPLLGRIRMGKVEVRLKRVRDLLMPGELFAVVCCDAANFSGVRLELRHHLSCVTI